jgi:hypothetical protein
MTPEEEAYAEALRRILKAKGRGAVRLDLSGFPLNRLPRELSALTSLQSLDLSGCEPQNRFWTLRSGTSA